MKYVQGNPNLKPIMVHEIALDFLDSYKWNGVHNLMLNAGVTYNKVTDIIILLHFRRSVNPEKQQGYNLLGLKAN